MTKKTLTADGIATHIHSDEMIPMNHDETDTYLTPDQLISELRTEIRHLKREYELLERTATGALSIVIEHALSIVIEQKHLNHEYELLKLTADDALFLVIDAVETHKVRFKHDSSTSAMEAPRGRSREDADRNNDDCRGGFYGRHSSGAD